MRPEDMNIPALTQTLKSIGIESNQVVEFIAISMIQNALKHTRPGERDVGYLLRTFENKKTDMKDIVIRAYAMSHSKNPIELTRPIRKPIIISTLVNRIKPLLDLNQYDDITKILTDLFKDETEPEQR
jgi:hypothetical protein